MIIEVKDKTINLVLKTRKIVDIANLLKNKNFEEAFIKAYSKCDIESLSKIIFKLAENEDGKAYFSNSDAVYDFIDDCRVEGITAMNLYEKISEALNEEGFFKKKMKKKELEEMISNPLSTIDIDSLMKNSVEKVAGKIIEEQAQNYMA